MGSNQAVDGNWQPGSGARSKFVRGHDEASDNELENRIRNLDKLVDSTHAALEQVSFSGKLHALDLVTDLRVKIKATYIMVRVAKLLSEPVRASMFSKIRDSVNDLEEVIASHLGVRMS